jgi:hypothetical protein
LAQFAKRLIEQQKLKKRDHKDSDEAEEKTGTDTIF